MGGPDRSFRPSEMVCDHDPNVRDAERTVRDHEDVTSRVDVTETVFSGSSKETAPSMGFLDVLGDRSRGRRRRRRSPYCDFQGLVELIFREFVDRAKLEVSKLGQGVERLDFLIRRVRARGR